MVLLVTASFLIFLSYVYDRTFMLLLSHSIGYVHGYMLLVLYLSLYQSRICLEMLNVSDLQVLPSYCLKINLLTKVV